MRIKEYIKEFKNSKIVKDAISKLKPTWSVIKNNGGYKILIISMLITIIFLPINALIKLIGKIMIGTSSIIGFSNILDMIDLISDGYYWRGESIVTIILFLIIAGILSIITYIVTTFIISNANFRSFKILAEEERVVSIGEYFKLAFNNLIPYSWKFFLNVILPILIINIMGNIINLLPFIKGVAIANFIVSIISYALIFRFFAMMLNIDYEKAVTEFSPYWFTFAIIAYLVQIITNLSIVTTFIEMIFILYSVLLLTKSKYYYQEE